MGGWSGGDMDSTVGEWTGGEIHLVQYWEYCITLFIRHSAPFVYSQGVEYFIARHGGNLTCSVFETYGKFHEECVPGKLTLDGINENVLQVV